MSTYKGLGPSSGSIRRIEKQMGVPPDKVQVYENHPTMANAPDGDYAANRRTRRMLRKKYGIDAKRLCDLEGGKSE